MTDSDTPAPGAPSQAGTAPDAAAKAALKEALAEVLHEHRALFREIVEDALAELALDEALRDADDRDAGALGVRDARFAPAVGGFAAVEGRA